MKKINLLYILIMVAGLFSCDDDYVKPNDFSDVSWYSVVHDEFDRLPIIGQRDYYSISDISQGTLEHKWELMDPNIYFLGGKIVNNDSLLEEKIIGGGNLGDISTEKTVHLYFPEGGIQSVRLYNTFDEEVSFVAKDTTIKSVYDDALGVHVFDHTFTVDVYHDVVAAYKVYQGEDSLRFADTDTIRLDLDPGDQLSFVQNVDSMYHITDVQWTIPTGVPATSTADSVVATFYSPGVVKGIKLKANRSGNGIPTSVDIVELPLVITVADGPFQMVDITKINSTSAKVQLSGVLKNSPTIGDFTVTAKNADLGQTFDIPVSHVALSDDKTSAILTFADPIYSNDEVEVAYAGTNVTATDGRPLESGSVVLDVIIPENLVGDPGFEEGGKWQTPPIYEGGRTPTGLAEYSMDMAKEGSYSMHAVKTAADDNTAFGNSSSFILEKGAKYTYSFDYYIVSSDGAVWESRISLANDDGTVKDSKMYSGWTNSGNMPKNQWVNKKATITGDGNTYTVAFLIYKAGKSIDAYFDNFSVTINDNRPAN